MEKKPREAKEAWKGLGKELQKEDEEDEGDALITVPVNGVPKDQKDCFQTALGLSERDADAWYHLGRAGGGKVHGNTVSERNCYRKAIELDEKHSDAWNGFGVMLQNAGHQAGSINGKRYDCKTCFRKALDLDSKDKFAWWNLGEEGGDDLDDEKTCFVRCLGLYGHDSTEATDVWHKLGLLRGAIMNGQRFRPKRFFQKAIELNEENADAWNHLGMECEKENCLIKGKSYSNKECFRKAIELDASLALAWLNLGLAGGDDLDNAKSCFKKSLEADAENAEAWYQFGMSMSGGTAFIESKRYTKKACFKKAVELDYEHADAWISLGMQCKESPAIINSKKYTETACYRAVIDYPLYFSADKCALAYYHLGLAGGDDLDAPKICFQKSLEEDESNADAWYPLGMSLAASGTLNGRTVRKKECFKNALERNEAHAPAWRAFGDCGGGKIQEKPYEKNACYKKAKEIESGEESGSSSEA